jgi:hypothetical protein
MTASTPSERPRSATIAYRSALVVIGVVALVVRLWSPGPTTEIYDENLWLQRSDNFSRSIADGRPGDASAALPSQHLQNPTMPGVTTMWAGVAGRQVARLSGALGLSEPIRGPSADSPQVLRASQGVVSVVCVATLLVLLVLLERLFDRRTSLITGALFATAPWIAAYGNLLHTDAMVTLFAVVAVCALRWGLHGERGAPPAEPDETPRTVGIMVSGVFAALAMLTKANAVGILAPGFTLLVWSAWRASRVRAWRTVGAVTATWVAVMGLVSVVLWPALLVSPLRQVDAVLQASSQVGRERVRFFDGAVRRGFVPEFYVVTLAFRLAPWVLATCVLGATTGYAGLVRSALRRRSDPAALDRRLVPAWVVLVPLPYAVVISCSRFGYDRYAQVLVPFGLIAGALVLAAATRCLSARRQVPTGVLVAGGLALTAASAAVPIVQAPYGINHASPVFGGQAAAVRWIPSGSQGTTAALDAKLSEHLGGRCDGITVASVNPLPASITCGTAVRADGPASLAAADYALSDLGFRQLELHPWYTRWLDEHGALIAVARIDGVVYGELWHLDH